MARKRRDYKAEYAARKRRAKAAGYRSEREYKRTRKALKTPRNASPVSRPIAEVTGREQLADAAEIRKMRREANAWSKRHSKQPSSAYVKSMSDENVRRYWLATVGASQYAGPGAQRKIVANWKDYLVNGIGLYTASEFDSLY